jgi:hypothetical protein
VDPDQPTSATDELTLRTWLYRYYWPFWLFRDASTGTLYARASAYRHNCEMSVYLPLYVTRWAVLCVITLAIVLASNRLRGTLEQVVHVAIVTGAELAFTCCFAIACIIASIYARFRFE